MKESSINHSLRVPEMCDFMDINNKNDIHLKTSNYKGLGLLRDDRLWDFLLYLVILKGQLRFNKIR